MNTYCGIPIIASDLIPESQPTIELRNDVNVSSEFRNKCNQFYIDMFGYKTVMFMVDGKYVANPRTIKMLIAINNKDL